MQLAIEIPDELGQRVLQHDNVQLFVQTAIEKLLQEEQQASFMKVPPLTKSLIGIMENSNIDELDYKRHLEEKYL